MSLTGYPCDFLALSQVFRLSLRPLRLSSGEKGFHSSPHKITPFPCSFPSLKEKMSPYARLGKFTFYIFFIFILTYLSDIRQARQVRLRQARQVYILIP